MVIFAAIRLIAHFGKGLHTCEPLLAIFIRFHSRTLYHIFAPAFPNKNNRDTPATPSEDGILSFFGGLFLRRFTNYSLKALNLSLALLAPLVCSVCHFRGWWKWALKE